MKRTSSRYGIRVYDELNIQNAPYEHSLQQIEQPDCSVEKSPLSMNSNLSQEVLYNNDKQFKISQMRSKIKHKIAQNRESSRKDVAEIKIIWQDNQPKIRISDNHKQSVKELIGSMEKKLKNQLNCSSKEFTKSQQITIQSSLGYVISGQKRTQIYYYKIKDGFNFAELTETQLKIGYVRESNHKNERINQGNKCKTQIIQIQSNKFIVLIENCCKRKAKLSMSMRKLQQYCIWIQSQLQVYLNKQFQSESSVDSQMRQSYFSTQNSSQSDNYLNPEAEKVLKYNREFIFTEKEKRINFSINPQGLAKINVDNQQIFCFSNPKWLQNNKSEEIIKDAVGDQIIKSIIQVYSKYWFENVGDL